MKRLLYSFLICLLILPFIGCASIITGKYQKIPITSEPSGVKVRSDTGESITTPGSFTLSRNEDHTLVAEFPGAETQQKKLKHGLQGWFWGNILFGGIIGGVVDLASGACDELQPEEIHFDFSSSGQQIANAKSNYLKNNPSLDEKIAFAIENGLLTTGMTKEQVLLSLGEPDEATIDGKHEILVYSKPKPAVLTFKEEKLIKIEDKT